MAATLFVVYCLELLLDVFGGVVEDFECASCTEFLFDVADHTHLYLSVGLDGEGEQLAFLFRALVLLFFDEEADVADIGYLVVELKARLGAVFGCEGIHRNTDVDVAYEAFLLEFGYLGTLRGSDFDEERAFAHRGDNHEEEQEHEDNVRHRAHVEAGCAFVIFLFETCHYFAPPVFLGSASEIATGIALSIASM